MKAILANSVQNLIMLGVMKIVGQVFFLQGLCFAPSKYLLQVFSWTIVVCRDKNESHSLAGTVLIFIQASQCIDKKIKSLIPEFIAPAACNQHGIL